jgi:hypothetical protein
MTETSTQIPLSAVMPIFAAISDRNWERFKELEVEFANSHGIEIWADVFNFRILPALDQESKRWFLIQKCSKGFTVKTVVE